MSKAVIGFGHACALAALAIGAGCSSATVNPGGPFNGSGSSGTSASGASSTGASGASAGTSSGTAVLSGASTGTSVSGDVSASGAGTGTSTGAASTGGSAGSGASGSGGAGTGAGSGGDGGASSGALEGGAPTGDGGACSVGMQTDPGSMGDGTTNINPPYVVPPESMALAAGATAGMLTTPALYASTNVYPGIKFQYTVFVPSQYQKGKPAALMIFLDGREWVTTPAGTGTIAWSDAGGWHADYVLANMIHAGQIPVTIAVFIDPGTKSGMFTGSGADNSQRSVEYDHPDDKYSQFTLNEFLPDAILPNYDIVQDPDGWSAIGHSSGGIAVFNMSLLHPDKFHKVLTFSASFPNTGGVYPAKIATTPLEPLRVHLLSSPNDLCCGWYSTNTQAAADLMTKGYHYQYIIGQSPHFPTPAGVQDFPNALRWMWRGYSLPCYP
jgi:enterochelin esterase family protein